MTCEKCGGEIVNGFCKGCGEEFLLGAKSDQYSREWGKFWGPRVVAKNYYTKDPPGCWSGGHRVLPKPTGGG